MNLTKLLALTLLLCVFGASAKDEPLMSIGVARIDITPDYPIRLNGYGGRRTNSEGVAQHIFAKALVFGSNRDGASILFTVDNLAVSGAITDEVAARLKKRAGIDREQVALCSSHTHSAPLLTGVAPNIFSSDIIPEQQAAIDRYTRELVDNLERVALTALSNRAPSKLSWALGTVTFAKNRRVVRGTGVQFGDNNAGPVDHTLATMFVHGADGKLRAVLANYACHCTTLGGEFNQVHGDWAGCAQQAIERDHPGAIALISIGCGGDANPSPRGKLENAQAHGDEIATEVRRLLALEGQAPRVPDQNGTRGTRPSNSGALTKLPEGKLKRFQLDFDPLPTRAQWEERAKKPGIVGYHAKKNLARLDRGEKLPTKLPYSVQTWTFGDDLAMVFLPGEVVVDYQRRLKREFDDTRLWVNGYANDVPCYIPSRRILTEGGYEAEDSLWYYDRPARLAMSSEDRIIKAVHDLMPKKFVANPNRAEMPAPLSPKQALNSMRVAPELTVDLVAAEPLVVDPVAIDWGADGKLWVAEMRDYPMGMDGNWKPGGRVKFLQDTNHDGHYDTATVLLDNLPFPTGVFAWRKGVLVCAAPNILYAEDTNGDGRADVVRKVFTGFATNNYQARVNSLSLGLDNWIYGANGLLGGTIRFVGGTSYTSPTLNGDSRSSSLQGELNIRGRDFRMNPDTGAFEPASGLTQQGRVRDDFGNWFGNDNSHLLWHYPLGDEYMRRNPHLAAPNPAVHVPQGRDWNRLFPASRTLERFNDPTHVNRVTSACGLEIYRDELLGKEFYGNVFTCEPVHNLVHREVLAPDGVTFRSTRATNELNREFLASMDNWFRPAQVRTGPDGALWVVDMYRYVIEHPRWIPSNRLATLNVRAGDDKGRIYRVYRKDKPPRPIPNFSRLSTPELAAALDSPNGTARDIVHRELLNRGDKDAAPKLAELAMKGSRSAVRVQAFSVLEGLGGMTPELVLRGLADADADVRQHAVRLSEPFLQRGDARLGTAVAQRAADSSLGVRYQTALGLGQWNDRRAAEPLAELLKAAGTNQWMRAAVLSSAKYVAPRLLQAAVALSDMAKQPELINALLPMTTAAAAERELATLIKSLSPRDDSQAIVAWRFDALANLLNRFAQTPPAKEPSPESETLQTEMRTSAARAFDFARAALANEQTDLAIRQAAVRFAGTQLGTQTGLEFFRTLLRPGPLQHTAIEAIAQSRDRRVPELLLNEWGGFSPSARAAALERLSSRPEWTDALLSAIEQKTISPVEVPAAARVRFLADKSELIRERAMKLWPQQTSDRAKLVAAYRKAITSSGDAEKGAQVFDRTCASCHALHGRGQVVGPDIAPLRDKSTEDFLVAILDPNVAIEPRYVNYIVETRSGNVFYGVVRSESSTSLQLVSPGIDQTLLRTDVARIEASSVSLMPEGLEQGITPSEMNDLIAFLKKPGPRSFGGATSEQIAAARKAFAAQQPRGFAKPIFASEQSDYPSWLGRLPLLHCRQMDGKSRVAWEATPVKDGSNECSFTVPAALGFVSNPAGKFTLRVNGKPALDFDVALDDHTWESADGKVRANYRVMEANAEDSNGPLTIFVARELATGNKPVNFEVIGSAANSQRWFGIYDVSAAQR